MKKGLQLVLLLFSFLSSGSLIAQKTVSLVEYDIKINGTSNLFNWWVIMEKATLNENLWAQNPDNLGICVSINPIDIRSSGGFIMNNIMRKALRVKTYPEILFRIKTFDQVQKNKKQYKIAATGNLTIADVSRQVKFNLIAQQNDKNQFVLWGQFPVRMTDFKITPPEVFNGKIKTDDNILLSFRFTLKSGLYMPPINKIDSIMISHFQPRR